MEEPLDDSFNVDFLIFEGLLLKIPRVCGIVNTFLLVFCGLGAQKTILVFDGTNRQKYFNIDKISGYFLH